MKSNVAAEGEKGSGKIEVERRNKRDDSSKIFTDLPEGPNSRSRSFSFSQLQFHSQYSYTSPLNQPNPSLAHPPSPSLSFQRLPSLNRTESTHNLQLPAFVNNTPPTKESRAVPKRSPLKDIDKEKEEKKSAEEERRERKKNRRARCRSLPSTTKAKLVKEAARSSSRVLEREDRNIVRERDAKEKEKENQKEKRDHKEKEKEKEKDKETDKKERKNRRSIGKDEFVLMDRRPEALSFVRKEIDHKKLPKVEKNEFENENKEEEKGKEKEKEKTKTKEKLTLRRSESIVSSLLRTKKNRNSSFANPSNSPTTTVLSFAKETEKEERKEDKETEKEKEKESCLLYTSPSPRD
eukprot:TRINITY_DN3784_c0_g1_i1.p1 TRINITY_DN3784_c0_g1~~TRINITY_DN3784_c0_g1_i1.p1  ORF type:complete len:351 (-),score=127.71 TRINITY_DN3784_c0_g1_i1:7-1059(-)